MNEAVLHTLRLARAYCADKLVWFAPALYQCKIILTEAIPVAAIDNSYNIYFNPKAIEIISKDKAIEQVVQEVGFLWIHEISHVLRDHSDRAKDRKADSLIWNIAADFEINDGIWEGIKMPEKFPGLLPHKYDLPNGKVSEFYYAAILDNEELKEKILQNIDVYFWDEGSGVHGSIRPWEEGSNRQQLHPIDRAMVARGVAQKLSDNRKFIGNLPGSWDVWIDKILKSRTDWRKILRHRMSTAIAVGVGLRVDYSFARPSRRQAVYHPIITPSFAGDRGGRIAIVVDTSGSMGKAEIGQAIGEVCRVLDDFKMPVTVIPCDAAAYEPIVLNKPSDRFKVTKLKGGGGTDMVVGVHAAMKLQPKPDAILILTDGYTPYPPSPFKTPVIFGIIYHEGNSVPPSGPPTPPWKKTATVNIPIQKK